MIKRYTNLQILYFALNCTCVSDHWGRSGSDQL